MAGEGVCPVCSGTGLIRKDGAQVSSRYATMPDIMAEHDPCWGCILGEQERDLWKRWNAA